MEEPQTSWLWLVFTIILPQKFGRMDRLLTFDENPDTEFSLPVVKIKRLSLFSIQAQYQLIDGATRLGKKFGGTGGTLTIIKFEDDKETLSIEGNSVVDRISQLTFVSRRNNISSPTLYNGPFGWQPLWSDYVAHACKIQRILMQLLSLLTHHSCVKGSSSP